LQKYENDLIIKKYFIEQALIEMMNVDNVSLVYKKVIFKFNKNFIIYVVLSVKHFVHEKCSGKYI